MFIEFNRPRQTRNPDPDASRGRLCVGLRKCDWTKVWYEPISTARNNDDRNTFDDEGAADLGLFKYNNPYGEPGFREPMEGEILWQPHFDPAKFDSTKKKERELLQKRFLSDAYNYCAELDPVKVPKMEKDLRDEKNRRWTSWFDIARKWKTNDMRLRGYRRKAREDLVPDDMDINECDINGDSSDDDDGDSGYGGDDSRAMPPPPVPPPSGGNGKRRAEDARAKGSTSSSKRRRSSTNGLGPSSNSSMRDESPYPEHMMSGGRGRRTPSRSQSVASDNIYGNGDDHDNDDSSVDYDVRHPTPTAEQNIPLRPQGPVSACGAGDAAFLQAYGINPHPTPIATQSLRGGFRGMNSALGSRRNGPSSVPLEGRDRSRTPDNASGRRGNLRPFNQWGRGAFGGREHDEGGLAENIRVAGFEQSPPAPGDPVEDLRRAAEINGAMTEEQALQSAREASVAMHRASMDRELPNGVRPSTENENDEEDNNDNNNGD